MDKKFQAYYTNSNSIVEYMISKLDIKINDTILEPSVGEGIFIDKLLQFNKNLKIETYDIDDYSIKIMNKKFYQKKNIHINHSNTLLDKNLDFKEKKCEGFSKIIGNPPYGAKLSKDIKQLIDIKYSSIYTKDTYVLFLYRCLNLLKKNGKLVFIIPDTFLYLNLHKKFRKFLFNNFIIEEICLFSSKLFPGTNFSYSKLSIITIQNNPTMIKKNIIKIYDSINNEADFINKKNVKCIPQKLILNQPNFNLCLDPEINKILNNSNYYYIEEIADCVTGIYTGDNKRFIKVLSENIRNSNGYSTIKPHEINKNHTKLKGINNSKQAYIPIIKGSIKIPYHSPKDEWFIDWSNEAVNYYLYNKKSRFQNSYFYFKKGIAIPMLKSKKINASLIENKVFDQSIVGIFPKSPKDIYFILALLNSDIVNKIIHNINPTVNNSANYLKRIPVPKCSQNLKNKINKLVTDLLYNNKNNYDKINKIITSLYLDML